mmetsp:Transcript_13857/g.25654  ORF Transcript_13857/g.25654 Transcript_13857/m.25654 type:complete len:84 (-) Transcript_13857:708-959(-)
MCGAVRAAFRTVWDPWDVGGFVSELHFVCDFPNGRLRQRVDENTQPWTLGESGRGPLGFSWPQRTRLEERVDKLSASSFFLKQ